MTNPVVAVGTRAGEALRPLPYRVVGRRQETADTVTIEFEADYGPGMEFAPGQFTMLYVFGVGEVPISIAGGDPARGTLLHTVRAAGAVTAAICGLVDGDVVGIRGPYGTAWPLAAATGRDLVVVAGGIGLAPLRPAVLEVLAHRGRYRTLSLLYGARSPADLLYEADLRAWRSRFDIEVEVTVDRADEDWHGDVGLVGGLLPRVAFEPAETVALLCGPEIMMKVVARELTALGVPENAVAVSLERNMKCAVGFCGHCQFGADFVCRDGPVVPWSRVRSALAVPEL